jgi:hypothetical protein
VRVVHHGIAQIQFGQIFDQGFNIADLFLFFATARGHASGKQLGFCDQVNACLHPAKTDLQRGRGDADFFLALLKRRQRFKCARLDVG